jgi:mono/diheme cytochrome c family protein
MQRSFLFRGAGALGPGAALALLLAASGCSRGGAPTIEAAPTVSAEVRGAALGFYKERCARCHGESGRGNGPDAAALPFRPQDLGDRMWQSNVTNQRLRKVLIHGGGAVGKSGLMPPSPELANKPELCDGLIAIVRGFGAPAP